MKIILFCHPDFSNSKSMPLFAKMLEVGFIGRGHVVERWSPQALVHRWFRHSPLAKWAGYIDQYFLFPFWVRSKLQSISADTLFVFCDQALGPWVPLVKGRVHVVHVHDLLALRSALGDIPENATSFSGRVYQRYIRRGFTRAKHFIAISQKTRADLCQFAGVRGELCAVVYNGLNFPYTRMSSDVSLAVLQQAGLPASAEGLVLHVGGAQWYKNLAGIINIYAHYAAACPKPLALWCIGPPPTAAIQRAIEKVPANGRVYFFDKLSCEALQAAYSLAAASLFPSLEEGFGWPIIESLACGCPVITTALAPMNEIGGDLATYLPRLTLGDDADLWAAQGAASLQRLLERGMDERQRYQEASQKWAARFDADRAIEAYLSNYRRIVDEVRPL